MSIDNLDKLQSTTVKDILPIAKYFLKLGLTGFGGPLALIQQMREDLTQKNKTIDANTFDQAFTFVKAMPGPIAFQMATFCGGQIAGFWGGLVAGLGITFPAFVMMLLLGVFYQTISMNVYLSSALKGSQYAVAAIILMTVYTLAKSYLKKIGFWLLIIFSIYLYIFLNVPETLIIFGLGLLVVLFKTQKHFSHFFVLVPVEHGDRLIEIFKVCLKAGAFIFGTGFAIFPVLKTTFVNDLGWLDIQAFNDALTFGQMTPGPVTIATTFMGYQMAGYSGAIVATLGLLLPPFIHISTWFPKALNWFSKQKWVGSFLMGGNAAIVGCLLVTLYNLNSAEYNQILFWIIFLLALFLNTRHKRRPVYQIIAIGALLHVAITIISINLK